MLPGGWLEPTEYNTFKHYTQALQTTELAHTRLQSTPLYWLCNTA